MFKRVAEHRPIDLCPVGLLYNNLLDVTTTTARRASRLGGYFLEDVFANVLNVHMRMEFNFDSGIATHLLQRVDVRLRESQVATSENLQRIEVAHRVGGLLLFKCLHLGVDVLESAEAGAPPPVLSGIA